MLIHRSTCSVLWEISIFRGNQQCWKKGLRIKDFPELDPSDWWELDDRTSLARRCKIYYPDFLPVLDGDRLIDIVPIGKVSSQSNIQPIHSVPYGRREETDDEQQTDSKWNPL